MNASSSLVEDNRARSPPRRSSQENIRFRGRAIKLKSNPLFRFNYFAACYNTNYNMVNGVRFKNIQRNRFYYWLYPLFRVRYIVVSLALSFVPFFNLLWLLILIALWGIYEKGHRVYKDNRKQVENPFERMVYNPEMCEKYRCMNKFLEVPVEYIQNEEIKASVRDGRVQIMIYNDKFKAMFYGFTKYRWIHITHICLSISIILADYLLLYHFVDFDPANPSGI
ncbi:unnamed protein product [Blepharisma stoltei]|uniref:Uncharacterized protein n=1 Tax=Blepharisma stoltei TaxID=1481888 RepID=A0AAU9JAI3_9CILI|nr:unnamed protein product [Blepharisma stoltei]